MTPAETLQQVQDEWGTVISKRLRFFVDETIIKAYEFNHLLRMTEYTQDERE